MRTSASYKNHCIILPWPAELRDVRGQPNLSPLESGPSMMITVVIMIVIIVISAALMATPREFAAVIAVEL